MRNLKALIIQNGTRIEIKILLDDTVMYSDSFNFRDIEHADGHLADIFHKLTYNRYKKPSEKLSNAAKLLGAH